MTWAIILIILSGIVACVSAIMCFAYSVVYDEMPLKSMWIPLLISVLIIAFICVGSGIASDEPIIQNELPYETKYLYALEDNNLTTGRGYYRRVQIDTDLYYQFLYKDGSGYKNDRVKAENTFIFEDDTTPRVEYYRTSQKWFIFESTGTAIKLYVPKDTISENYNIDLE